MPPAFRSKKEVVYEEIRQKILEGHFQPGSRLVIDELSQMMGVSQIPIREAMRQLEADGFVTIEPHVGARIAPIDASFIYEIFALLEALEVISTRAACQNISEEQLEQLQEMVDAMDTSIEDPTIWTRQNKDMHLFICDIAKTDLVRNTLIRVLDHWDRLRSYYMKDVFAYRITNAQDDHKLILDAIINRDPDKAERVIHKHNQTALQSYITHLQSKGHLVTVEGS